MISSECARIRPKLGGIVPRMPLLNLSGLPVRPEAFGPLPSGVVPVAFDTIAAGPPGGPASMVAHLVTLGSPHDGADVATAGAALASTGVGDDLDRATALANQIQRIHDDAKAMDNLGLEHRLTDALDITRGALHDTRELSLPERGSRWC